MTFVHEDAEFEDLIRIVARETGLSAGLVEKDYWVTHTLWALHETELEVWFKGGTCLYKGFELIQRFSEDLDLRLEPGKAKGVPPVKSWTSRNKGPVAERTAFFESLERAIQVPAAKTVLDRTSLGKDGRSANYRVEYPGKFLDELEATIRPYVLLEVGVARVTPFVPTSLTSFIHKSLEKSGNLAAFSDNRPSGVRCVHPLVTLIEKLDAISRRYGRSADPASFVRHYEDAASIIEHVDSLPALEMSVAALLEEILEAKQIAHRPTAEDPAFVLDDKPRREALTRAHAAIAPMYWGARCSLDVACDLIRGWLERQG